MPARLTISPYSASRSDIMAVNCAGDCASGASEPRASSASTIVGCSATVRTALCSAAMTSGGVFAGAARPIHEVVFSTG